MIYISDSIARKILLNTITFDLKFVVKAFINIEKSRDNDIRNI